MQYKYDTTLKLSDRNFGRQLHRNQYNCDAANEIPFPDDAVLTKLAHQAYYDDVDEGWLPADWILLTDARNARNGYVGVAFWNVKLCHVVVAHRGTSNLAGVLTCLKLIFNKPNIEQAQSAASFVYLISEQIKIKNDCDGPRFQLSITGHSLGGWLAQITALAVEYCKVVKGQFVRDEEYLTKNIHAHTVTIDNPGCEDEVRKLLRSLYLTVKAFDSLDVTVCLGKPNFVTTIKKHIGRICTLPVNTHKIVDFVLHFDSFAFIRNPSVSMSKSICISKSFSRSVGLLRHEFPALESNSQDSKQYSLNVFTEREKCFVRAWLGTVINYPSVVQKIRNKFSVPHFEVDYVRKIIKGDNVLKIIASIRNIPSIQKVTRKMLEECAEEELLISNGCASAKDGENSTRQEIFSFLEMIYNWFGSRMPNIS